MLRDGQQEQQQGDETNGSWTWQNLTARVWPCSFWVVFRESFTR
jgi:hypothetical protein